MADTAAAKSSAEPRKNVRRKRIGVVETDVRQKTIKVRIDRLIRHPKYGKFLRRKLILHAHDEKNEAHSGDVVEIAECRPLSKTKSWRLVRIVRRSEQVQ